MTFDLARRLRAGVRVRPNPRALAVYVTTIVVPTLVLLVLGTRAVRSQRDAIVSLSAANQRLEEARFADAVEQAVAAGADECLLDPAVAQLAVGRAWGSPETAGRARRLLDDVARRHPLARHLFLVEGRSVRLPRVESLPVRTTAEHLSMVHESDLADGFTRAEALERPGKYGEALTAYRRLSVAAAIPSTRALALARMARCAERAGDQPTAVAAYRELAARFPDAYDPAGRPAALVAAAEIARVEPGAVEPGGGGEQAARPGSVRRDLLDGRWEISADEADYFLSRLGGLRSRRDGPAPYLDYLEVGRGLAAWFEPRDPIGPGHVYQAARSNGTPTQVYYVGVRGSGGRTIVVGLIANLDYIVGTVCPRLAVKLGLKTVPRVLQAGSGATAFRQAMPFWEVSIQPLPAAAVPAMDGETIVFGATVALVLGVLVLGVVLLMRDVAREGAIARLQADMVGGVSHELKTPLTVIRMYAETLGSRTGASDGERKAFADVIVQESDRLTRLINGVLEFTRLDRGARTYRLQGRELAPLVARTVDQYRPYLEQQGFRLETDYGPPAGGAPEVRADAEAVSQALVNLLDNAAKYSGDERHVAIRVGATAGEAFVEVEDRGEGIAPKDLDRIFTKYFRAPTRTGRGGHGLGLFVVRQLMEGHGGRVEVASKPGHGSRFRLVFPVARPDSREEE